MRRLGRLPAPSAAPLDAVSTALVKVLRGGKERPRGAALTAAVALVAGRQQWALEAARPMLPALATIVGEGIAKVSCQLPFFVSPQKIICSHASSSCCHSSTYTCNWILSHSSQ
jgi:hypothetical protein